MKKISIIAILTITVFSSCMGPEKKRCIKHIDSLMTLIDSSLIFYSRIDSTMIFNKFNKYKEIQDEAGTYSSSMKPDDPHWDYLIPFANIEKPYKKALSRYLKFSDEISFSKNQLKNLRQDIKNDFIDSKKFADYYQSENDAINDMFLRIKFFNEDINYFNARIDTLSRHIKPLLEKLRKLPASKANLKPSAQEEND